MAGLGLVDYGSSDEEDVGQSEVPIRLSNSHKRMGILIPFRSPLQLSTYQKMNQKLLSSDQKLNRQKLLSSDHS
ncbi:hypothetical protein CJF30_00005435 [Rutstroemia sp. NJR-2017a BBW]|nr:hypothetical protein CJF30_00005949 [Rutstroemia sp. NJR-2017a BBW]PQE08576.1 hypothetical protein CJF30_00005435 [Rutstroemia sp. NJR-2017a BBW]